MRFSTIISLAVAATPLAVFAARGQLGYALGAKRSGMNAELARRFFNQILNCVQMDPVKMLAITRKTSLLLTPTLYEHIRRVNVIRPRSFFLLLQSMGSK